MGLMTYNRVGSGRGSSSSSCPRGFKLNPRKFYVLRLRKRLGFFLTLFDKCKLSYSQALRLLKRVFRGKTGFRRRSCYSNRLVKKGEEGGEERIKKGRVFYARTNSSFYAEAIADCLEFIKRTSISMDQVHQDTDNIHVQD